MKSSSGTSVTSGSMKSSSGTSVTSGSMKSSSGTLVTSGNMKSRSGMSVTSGNMKSRSGTSVISGSMKSSSGTSVTSGSMKSSSGTSVTSGSMKSRSGTSVTSGSMKSSSGTSVTSGSLKSSSGTSVTSGNMKSRSGTSVTSGSMKSSSGTSVTSGSMKSSSATFTCVSIVIMEYNEVIALIFSVDGRINEINHRIDNPAQSKLMPDLLHEWQKLDDELTNRETDLKRELAHQESLERLASAFRRKVFVREESLKDPEEWVQQDGSRSDFSSTAVIHRLYTLHSLSAELQAKENLFPKLSRAAQDLLDQNYDLGEDFCAVAEGLASRYKKVLCTVTTLLKEAETHPQLAEHLMRLDAFEEHLQKVKTTVGNIKLDNSQMSVLTGLEIVAHAKTSITSIRKSFNKVAQNSSPFQKLDDATAKFFIQRLKDFHKLFKDADESRKAMQRSLTSVLMVANIQENLKALNDWTETKKSLLRRKVAIEDYGAMMAVKEALELALKEHVTKGGLVETMQKQLQALREKETQSSSGGFSAFEKDVTISIARFARLKNAMATQKKRLNRLVAADEFLDELDHADKWLTERLTASSADNLVCKTVADVDLQLHYLTRLDADLVNFNSQLNTFQRKATTLIDVAETRPKTEDTAKEQTSSSSSSSSSSDSSRDVTDAGEKQGDFIEKTCQVMKALYPYDKKGVTVKKGEELILVSTGDRWCAVKKFSGEEGFVPTSYIKESGSRIVRIKAPQQKRRPSNLSEISIRRQNFKLNAEISQKLHNIEDAFTKLQQKISNDREELQDAKKFLIFMENCDGFRAWIKEQEGFVKAALNDKKNSEATLRNLNEYTVRVVAGETRMKAITNMAKELVDENVKELNKVEKVYQDTAFEWNRFISLNKKKEEKLEDSSRNDEFGAQCKELKLWLLKMQDLLQGKKYGDTLQETISLIPENERLLNEVIAMKKTLDEARENIGNDEGRDGTLKELRRKWRALKKEVEERKDKLDDTRKIHAYMKELQKQELKKSQEHLQKSWTDKGQFLKQLSELRVLEQTMTNMATIFRRNNRIIDHLCYESLVELTRSKFELKTMEEEMSVQHKNFSKMDDALHDLQDLDSDRLLPVKRKRRKLEDDFQQLLLRISQQKVQVDTMLDKFMFLDHSENFIQWMAAKMVKVKVSVEHDDLEAHLKKHRNLELEISSGAKQYGALLKTGEQLLRKNKDDEVSKALDKIKVGWKELHECTAEKLIILDQANAYSAFCSKVNGINHQFQKIGSAVDEDIKDGGFDELRKRENEHRRTMQNMKFVATKIEETITMGTKLVDAKHTEAENIKKQLKTIESMYEKLKKAVQQRGLELSFKLDVAQLLLDAERLSGWIAAQSELLGKTQEDKKLLEEAIQRLQFLSDVRLNMSIKKRSLDTILERGDSFSSKGALHVSVIKKHYTLNLKQLKNYLCEV
ncbi:Spectrin repeat [Trinorchestia longiramus]|nr:Spectrin repeat [Trinorchestia longiramus]